MSTAAERELRRIAQGQTPEPRLAHAPPDDAWLVLRAAGSLGAADLTLMRGARALVLEVKATSTVTEKGGATVNLTAQSGRGVEQRDALHQACIDYDLTRHQVGFAVRRKHRLPEGVPRWTWHPLTQVGDETVIRAWDGYHLLPWLQRPAAKRPATVPPQEVPA